MATLVHILVSSIYFLILIGVVIFIHELGHFLLARAVGVTVVKFSLGFGPRLFGFTRNGTEFLVSAVPLGGYCKFLGDDPEKPLAPEDRQRGFLTTDIWRRTLIVLAGPVFNLVLPLLIFLPITLSRTTLPPAVLGSVSVDGPAWEAGLRAGDKLVAIDGRPVSYWYEMLDAVSDNPGRKMVFTVERAGATGEKPEILKLPVTPNTIDDPYFKRIGFSRKIGQIEVIGQRPRAVLGVIPGSPAEQAGFRHFDTIVDVDGWGIWTWDELLKYLSWHVGTEVKFQVARVDLERWQEGIPAVQHSIKLTVPADPAAYGLSDAGMDIGGVTVGSTAEKAGLRRGDRVTALNGRTYIQPQLLQLAMMQNPEIDHVLTIQRAEGPVNVTVSMKNPDWEPGSSKPQYIDPGIQFRVDYYEPPEIPNRHVVSYALKTTWEGTANMFVSTVASLGAVVTGRVSFKEMGGPIMIFDLAGKAGKQGLVPFLSMLMFISVSLGVMNLLPIPLLDGGHLVLFGWEKIRRRPPTMRERGIWSWVGMVFLALLMLLVMKNDIFRLLG